MHIAGYYCLIFIAMKKRLLMVVMALSCLTFVDAREVEDLGKAKGKSVFMVCDTLKSVLEGRDRVKKL